MTEHSRNRLAWVFAGLAMAAVAVTLAGGDLAVASEDHEVARSLRAGGDIVPLADLLARVEATGARVLEAELDREHGQLVYELEILDEDGKVRELYYDASNGEPLTGHRDD